MYFSNKINIFLIFLGVLAIGATKITKVYEFNQKAFYVPHPDKAYRGGEDANFQSKELMIVADGVGSWADFGVDPGFYSRFLCSKGGELFQANKTFYRKNLVELITQASNLNTFVGSSTMVAATIYGDKLRTSYIGDSGFVIFRLQGDNYKLFFEFKQQQHGFNFPFQLAMQQYFGDDPYLSISQEFAIQENDIVVMGSDGLFDNVFVTEIMNMINMNKENDEKLFTVPQTLANLAIKRGADLNFQSPFQIKAKQLMLTYQGGKLDDTTVILAKIRKAEVVKIVTDESKIVQNPKGEGSQQAAVIDTEQVSTYDAYNEGGEKNGNQEGDIWEQYEEEYYYPQQDVQGDLWENGDYNADENVQKDVKEDFKEGELIASTEPIETKQQSTKTIEQAKQDKKEQIEQVKSDTKEQKGNLQVEESHQTPLT